MNKIQTPTSWSSSRANYAMDYCLRNVFEYTVNSRLLPALDYNPLLLTTRIFCQKLNFLLSKNTPLSRTTLIRDRQKTYYPRVVSAILRYTKELAKVL